LKRRNCVGSQRRLSRKEDGPHSSHSLGARPGTGQ
jgi:hypothetical protein